MIHSQILGVLRDRPFLARTIENVCWLCADKALQMGIGMFVSVWVARYLGPDRFGQLAFAESFIALFNSFATLGLGGIVVRDIVRSPELKSEILGSAFVLRLSGASLAFGFAVAAISWLRPDSDFSRLLVAIYGLAMLAQVFDVVDFWFQSQVRSKYIVYARNAAYLTMAGAKLALIQVQAPLMAFALSVLAENLLFMLGCILAYRRTGGAFTAWTVRLSRMRVLLCDSWPLALSGMAIIAQAYVDQIMIGEMIGDAEVGQYSVALRLVSLFAFLPMIVQSSVAPSVTKAKLVSERVYRERLVNVYRLCFILFVFVYVPVLLLGDSAVRLLYGVQYERASVLLQVMAARLFFTFFGLAKGLFVTNESLFRYALLSSVAGAIVNLALNCVLIPLYSSIGAVVSSLISFAVTTFVLDMFFPRTRVNLFLMLSGIVTPWKFKLR